MLSIAWQRRAFLAVAAMCLVWGLFIPRLSSSVETVITGVLILFLGVPHGALDLLYLRKVLGIKSPLTLGLSMLAYCSIAGLVFALWKLSPLLFLLFFLLAAALHFSGDLEKAHSITRATVGIGVIVWPSLFHGDELTNLYSLLTNQTTAESVVRISYVLALLCLGLVLVGLFLELRRQRTAEAGEMCAAMLLALVAPPLVAFACYFCFMHSARHIVRTSQLIPLARRAFVLECVAPMVAVLIIAIMGWKIQSHLSLDARVIQTLFVLLAALTAPHMVIVEPIRFHGWKTAGEKSST
ncbi:MAG: Brp/Blh family beta-carotene 15,15'-dioxygenase [Armatimonadota bacterium]